MKVENFRSEKRRNRARVAATVTWENCNRPPQEVYFETDEAFADSLSCNPHAFLVGCIIPAMHFGEERILMDAQICPELSNNLMAAMGWLRHWYDPDKESVRIEAKTASSIRTPRTPERAGFFFSGGIDSFATLRTNRLDFPLGHPWSIKDGLLVYGLEMDTPDSFELVAHLLSGVAQDLGITFIPVYTNIYLHYRDEDEQNRWDFWTYKFMGAALAAVAHAFAQRFTVFSMASSYDIPNLHPHALNPLLNYSSSDLRVRLDGITLSRLTKTKLVADQDVALRHLRICNNYKDYRPGRLNCGRCEKCIRTMLGLLAAGGLERAYTFPKQDVSAELVRKAVFIKNSHTSNWYQELIVPLTKRGRHDLAQALELKLAEYHKHKRIKGWRERIKQFDTKYTKGELAKLKKVLSHGRGNT